MKRFFKAFAVCAAALIVFGACTPSNAATDSNGTVRLERVKPSQVGMDEARLSRVDEVINASIEKKEIPGAVLAVVRNGKMAYIKAYGNKSVYPEVVPVVLIKVVQILLALTVSPVNSANL